MAKYSVEHSCGHSSTVDLIGPGRERESKLAWLGSRPCKSCWAAQRRAAEAAQPITMAITSNGLDRDQDGRLIAEVVLSGGTEPRRDEIRGMGYSWETPRGSVLGGLLAMSAPPRRWIKIIPLESLLPGEADQPSAILRGIVDEAKALGTEPRLDLGPIDLAMIARTLQKDAEARQKSEAEAAAIAALPPLTRPACHPREAHPEGHWNGKYYGNEKYGYRYYVSNREYRLTKAEYDECMAYRQAVEARDAEIKKIKEA